MKHLITVVLLALTLAACGKREEESQEVRKVERSSDEILHQKERRSCLGGAASAPRRFASPVRRGRVRPNQLRQRSTSLQPTRTTACSTPANLSAGSEPVQPCDADVTESAEYAREVPRNVFPMARLHGE